VDSCVCTWRCAVDVGQEGAELEIKEDEGVEKKSHESRIFTVATSPHIA